MKQSLQCTAKQHSAFCVHSQKYLPPKHVIITIVILSKAKVCIVPKDSENERQKLL